MCTVTYLPLNEGFILTTNRDEDPHRARAEQPGRYNADRPQVIFPRDPQGQGSWVAVHENGSARCLLNGAFTTHKHDPPYRHSRGLVPLHSFDYHDPYSFLAEYNASELEPFTLIWVESGVLSEFRWDEQTLHYREYDPATPAIWSSAQLYTDDVRAKREGWFEQWLNDHGTFTQEEILRFHHFGGEGNSAEDLVMNPSDLPPQTISVTSFDSSSKLLHYHDLLSDHALKGFVHFFLIKNEPKNQVDP